MKEQLTLVIDPRFGGGTSSAVAREIDALALSFQLSVAAISSKHFKGRDIHKAIDAACERTGTPIEWDPKIISSTLVAVHNPSFLKFNETFATQIRCDRLFVVCHENFLRPGGEEGFDVGHCLKLLEDATLSRRKFLMPVSEWNRTCAKTWLMANPVNWTLSRFNWSNICDFVFLPATTAPRDRRGRHSRAGAEKFPRLDVLKQMFPASAQAIRILGAESLIDQETPPCWDLIPFGGEDVDAFLQTIDFFIYFTNPLWQESFGRVIAEAIAAGKVVISNAETAATFGDGVVAALPDNVDAIVARMIADPTQYSAQVARGQKALERFSADAFRAQINALMTDTKAKHPGKSETEVIYDIL
jgi:hypothetical protein